MNLARIGVSYLRTNDRGILLNVVLFGFGVAAITLLMLTARQLEERMYRDARGIDLVLGARGSAEQLVLSAVYELDVSTPAVSWMLAQAIAAKQQVANAIPVARGDNYQGLRVIGTTHEYVTRFKPRLREGRLWQAPLEVVIGSAVASRTGLRVGRLFAAAHGSGYEHEPLHGDNPYRVVGELRRTGTVLDHLIVTGLESVWTVHSPPDTNLVKEPSEDDPRSVNALLITTRSAAGTVALAEEVNASADLQAVSPASIVPHIFGIIFAGIGTLRVLGVFLIAGTGICVFFALYGALSQRRYDLAIMRALGASPLQIMVLLLFEGISMAAMGAALGLLLGHLLTSLVGFVLHSPHIGLTGWAWYGEELWIVAGAVGVGFFAALIPAWDAHETDIAAILARG